MLALAEDSLRECVRPWGRKIFDKVAAKILVTEGNFVKNFEKFFFLFFKFLFKKFSDPATRKQVGRLKIEHSGAETAVFLGPKLYCLVIFFEFREYSNQKTPKS